VLLSAQARADTFAWTADISWMDSVSGTSGVSLGSGTITATPVDASDLTQGYTATGITGTYGGETIIGLLDVDDPNAQGADNLIFPDTSSLIDVNGIAFSLADPIYPTTPTSDIDLYGLSGVYYDAYSGSEGGTFTLTAVSQVPEPGSVGLLAAGCAILGFVGCARRVRRS
jgi:hypothetical protein